MILIKYLFTAFFCLGVAFASAQTGSLSGKIFSEGAPVVFANIVIKENQKGTSSDLSGSYKLSALNGGTYTVMISAVGYFRQSKTIFIKEGEAVVYDFELKSNAVLNEVVITGTLKEVSRLESPVPVEVYTPAYFKKNPTPSIFDAMQNVNGVRPQLNCNVCSTGDIHINGLEGPYTMILIDGMPIVSSLSSVYGLSGIPNSLVERIEVVKGPASSLYGSEAIGGLINIITKKPQNAPLLFADSFSTDYAEYNTDIGFKFNASKKISALTGINYFNYSKPVDNNNDNFTDVTLQHRISLFQKWNIERKENRMLSFAARYMYEDRWGGEMNWEKKYRGGNEIYGESIYTKRWELFGNYQLPIKEKMLLAFSYNDHNQNSVYGTTTYLARQKIAFTQLSWDKKYGAHDLLSGISFRYTNYDDNTPATASSDYLNETNKPDKTYLPGIFLQDEISITAKHKLLLGFRYDYNNYHGNIFTPRFAYKWSVNENNIIRLNAGTGFRVVNLFTEDHAALTGARDVEIKNELKPEQSNNANINYLKKIFLGTGSFIGFDATAFYSYFTNRILPDYETNPTQIIYNNLSGYSQSKGISLNVDFTHGSGLKILAGGTLMENSITQNSKTTQQILTEKITGVWALSYKIKKAKLTVDYTGNIYGPMRLPLLNELDPRKKYSQVWSLQNIQLVFDGFKNFEIYGGVKNLLDWTPNKGNPFIIARSNDPFDKQVKYDAAGNVVATTDNPYALTFDPSYVFAPNQGIRFFLGVRYFLK